MINIFINTRGVKWGIIKSKNVGYLVAYLRNESDLISIDDFRGIGENYKQRETQLIRIIENGKILFSGDKYELFEQLKK